MSGRHLTEEEVVNRVFPSEDGTPPVPIHLAVCPECQARVSKLREAFLLDRGAVTGVLETLPGEFWSEQRRGVMGRISELAEAAEAKPAPFPARFTRSILHRPALAFGSLAAALALVAGLTVLRSDPAAPGPEANATVAAADGTDALPPADREDDELLRSIDTALSGEATHEALLPETMR